MASPPGVDRIRRARPHSLAAARGQEEHARRVNIGGDAHHRRRPSAQGPRAAPRRHARSVAIALVGAAILGVVTPYSDLFLNGTWIAACHLPIGAFMLFVVLAAVVNVILRALARRLALSRAELLVSYCVMLAGAGIPSFGLTEYLIPTLAGAFYFQTPENNWVAIFFRYIPQWFVPVDLRAYPGYAGAMPGWAHWLYAHLPHWMQPASPRIITYFYEGLPHSKALPFGHLVARVPWGAWFIPIAVVDRPGLHALLPAPLRERDPAQAVGRARAPHLPAGAIAPGDRRPRGPRGDRRAVLQEPPDVAGVRDPHDHPLA